MANTGIKKWQNLEEFNVATGIATGNTKPNVVGDPDYVAPVQDTTLCPLPATYLLTLPLINTISNGFDLKEKVYGMTFEPSLTEDVVIDFEIYISLRRQTTTVSNFISYAFSKDLDSGFDSSANKSLIERGSASNMTDTIDYDETIPCSITVLAGESVTFNIYTSSSGTYRNESRAWTNIIFNSSTPLSNLPKNVFQTVSSVDGGAQ